MESAIISVKNLSRSFKTHERGAGLLEAFKSLFARKFKVKHALSNVSFEIREGEIIGLIGPNGAGKSTIIKTLCGILLPDSGEVSCLGFKPWEDRIKYVQHIGAVFGSKPMLWWDLPAIDSFDFSKDIYGIPEREFRRRLNNFIKKLGLESVSKQPARDLSLGERMKCNLVMSLLHNPKIVFLDEPTIGVDIIAKDVVREFILDANKSEKTTFIITTHDLSDIEALCERVIIINEGKIIFDGLLEKVRDKFMHKKVIEVELARKGLPFKFEGCRVLRQTDLELEIEVDTRKQNISYVIDFLLKKYDVEDLLVSDPEIEEIIKMIYGRKKV